MSESEVSGPWVLVEDESGDCYMIPDNRREEWYDDGYAYGEVEMPEWAHGSPGGSYWFVIDSWHTRRDDER